MKGVVVVVVVGGGGGSNVMKMAEKVFEPKLGLTMKVNIWAMMIVISTMTITVMMVHL